MTKTAIGPDEPDWRWVQNVTAPVWRTSALVWFLLWATWTIWRAVALVCAGVVLIWFLT